MLARMGVSDRGYMAGEGGLPRSAGVLGAPATMWLVGVNVIVLLAWAALRRTEFMQLNFTLTTGGVLYEYRVHTLLTAAFSHVDPWHAVFNLLALWFFGTPVENLFGRRAFLAIYLSAAIFSSLVYVAVGAATGDLWTPMLGASGAVMAVLVLCALYYRNMTVLIWGILPVKMWLLATCYVAFDLMGLLHRADSGVAHAAHLGGAAAGLAVYSWRRLGPAWRPWGRGNQRGEETLGGAARETGSGAPANARQVDPATAARVDALLEKVHEQGLTALTDDEKAFLIRNSARYRR
ncbi:MAG: rhomboid family intramembrane serine protease [Planctomycetes bacterium]|nr:rhomboid family intramembrane serine protease [Planctomycetota bacterium]